MPGKHSLIDYSAHFLKQRFSRFCLIIDGQGPWRLLYLPLTQNLQFCQEEYELYKPQFQVDLIRLEVYLLRCLILTQRVLQIRESSVIIETDNHMIVGLVWQYV